MEFFPYRTDAYEGITEGYLITAGLVVRAFDEMDFVVNAEFHLAKSVFTG